MALVREDTKGKIRDLPIHDTLRKVLSEAADAAGIPIVRVTSGGQCAKGTCQKRTGSTRHDLGYAADLQLLVDGHRALDFTKPGDRSIVADFVTAAAHGASGIGAGVDYMGSTTLHVGFGTSPADTSRLVWGAGGASANAPDWLRIAAKKGWQTQALAAPGVAAAPRLGRFSVIARDGVKVRGGPGLNFPILSSIKAGGVVSVMAFEGSFEDWARVDIQGDGLVDGHVHRAFLAVLSDADGSGSEGGGFFEESDEPEDVQS